MHETLVKHAPFAPFASHFHKMYPKIIEKALGLRLFRDGVARCAEYLIKPYENHHSEHPLGTHEGQVAGGTPGDLADEPDALIKRNTLDVKLWS